MALSKIGSFEREITLETNLTSLFFCIHKSQEECFYFKFKKSESWKDLSILLVKYCCIGYNFMHPPNHDDDKPPIFSNRNISNKCEQALNGSLSIVNGGAAVDTDTNDSSVANRSHLLVRRELLCNKLRIYFLGFLRSLTLEAKPTKEKLRDTGKICTADIFFKKKNTSLVEVNVSNFSVTCVGRKACECFFFF